MCVCGGGGRDSLGNGCFIVSGGDLIVSVHCFGM